MDRKTAVNLGLSMDSVVPDGVFFRSKCVFTVQFHQKKMLFADAATVLDYMFSNFNPLYSSHQRN